MLLINNFFLETKPLTNKNLVFFDKSKFCSQPANTGAGENKVLCRIDDVLRIGDFDDKMQLKSPTKES